MRIMIIRSPVQASVDNIVPQWVGTTLHGSCLLLVYTGKYLHFIFHTHLLIALIERRPIYRSDLLVRNSPIWPPWALYREYLHSLGSFCSRMRMSYRVNSLVEVSPLSRTSPVNRIWYHIYLAWQMRACESWLEAEQYLLL